MSRFEPCCLSSSFSLNWSITCEPEGAGERRGALWMGGEGRLWKGKEGGYE